MAFQSVDQLQKVLMETVFHYAQDKKKAAGRALGTLVEIVTFYALRAWGLRDFIGIERPLPEFGNPDITHNVEYSLHPKLETITISMRDFRLPISTAKLLRLLPDHMRLQDDKLPAKTNQLLTTDRVLRNSCTIAEADSGPYVAHLDSFCPGEATITLVHMHRLPFAIFECKRVGIEEGMRKGPQTIEKAKQGAYVARTVSSLQKLRLRDGRMGGVIHRKDGRLYCKPYGELLREVVASDDPDLLDGFILTVGVVSNHGNWFTSDNPNKELKVLAQSYDWLLFLTDQGLSEFIDELLLHPIKELMAAREAFAKSYTGEKGNNRFTKVQMDLSADMALQHFFKHNAERTATWFNVIAPRDVQLATLRTELEQLSKKDWKRIRSI